MGMIWRQTAGGVIRRRILKTWGDRIGKRVHKGMRRRKKMLDLLRRLLLGLGWLLL
jgi:hypothetical protein